MNISQNARLSTPANRLQQRRLRKGTKSCWECKRKKAKCTFSNLQNSVCDGCERRGTSCVSQELPEPMDQGRAKDRLGRVEAMLAKLTANSHAEEFLDPIPLENRCIEASLNRPTSNLVNEPAIAIGDDDAYDDNRQAFLQAWPSQRDMEILSKVPIQTIYCVHEVMAVESVEEHRQLPPQTPSSILQVLTPPKPKSPPAKYARPLIALGLSLQGLALTQVDCGLDELSVDCQELMSRAMSTAHRLLMCEGDEAVVTVEHVQCLALEGLYYCLSGDLRRSWFVVRRAMMMAQWIGLHRDTRPTPPSPSAFAGAAVPNKIWFELVQIDSYLSLVLGRPGSSFCPSPTNSGSLHTFEPQQRLRRVHCFVSERILKRHGTELTNIESTRELDILLRKAASWMPPQWWLDPTPVCTSYGKMGGAKEAGRIRDQLLHYNLIVQLHWPHLLDQSLESRSIHSKICAVNASRELLVRFVAVNMHETAGYYCRGISILALVATATLCVVYMGANSNTDEDSPVSHLLHQRPGDRGMMEQALESMDQLSRTSSDSSAPRIGRVLRQLLVVEGKAANGSRYRIFSPPGHSNQPDFGCDWDCDRLRVCIPSFGSIQFDQEETSEQSTIGTLPVLDYSASPTLFAYQQDGATEMSGWLAAIDDNQDNARWQDNSQSIFTALEYVPDSQLSHTFGIDGDQASNLWTGQDVEETDSGIVT